MKICIVNNFPPYSGVGRVAYEFWRDLQKMDDIEVDMYCTHAMNREEFDHKENKGVNFLHKFPYDDNRYLSRILIYFIDRFRIPKGYDVYHFTNHMISFMINRKRLNGVVLFDLFQMAKQVDKGLGVPIVNDLYDWLIRKSVAKTSKADAVICVSDFTKQEAIRLLNLDPRKAHVVHTGISHEVFKPRDKTMCRQELDLPLDKKIVLHVGSEIVRKNVITLIKAFSKVKQDAVLVRVGTKDSDEVQSLINKLGLQDKVIYRESFFPEEVAKYYCAADAHAFPSLAEGFGLPIIEAMACGCPVITANYGAMKEVAGDGAYLIDPEDVNELVATIEKTISLNENSKQEVVERGLKRAQQFTSENFTNKVVEIYKNLL